MSIILMHQECDAGLVALRASASPASVFCTRIEMPGLLPQGLCPNRPRHETGMPFLRRGEIDFPRSTPSCGYDP
jgi:hypothetical protein